ncbi:hypothetical protein BJ165DRAFT_1545564 [Panaeolus papilionaceus]|nr:hypothetical protein BJ165DRAFT_1545564 [Panaeolus papilionaceus]
MSGDRPRPRLRGTSPPLNSAATLNGSSSNSQSELQSTALQQSDGTHGTTGTQPGMFSRGSRLLFHGGNTSFQQHTHFHQGFQESSNIKGLQKLHHNASPAAAYNSRDRYDPPKCHPNTRTGLLNVTKDWTKRGSSRILWLYGSAGAGKSAVAQTLSEWLREGDNLAASFFFSRTAPADSHRGHEGRFVSTIAYQLVQSIPGLRLYVEQIIDRSPSVFNLTLKEQVLTLIIGPMGRFINEKPSDEASPCTFPRIIVVDGLDECEESGQEQVLEAIATLVGHEDVFPSSVFLSSRPDLVIRSWFSALHATHPLLTQSVSLLDECDSDHDIKIFVEDEGAKIRQSHPFKSQIPIDWPTLILVEEIVRRACGQFIYASTVMKYVKHLRDHPDRRLGDILQNTIPESHHPYVELDALYLHILRRTHYPALVHQLLAFRMVSISFCGYRDGDDYGDYLRRFHRLPSEVDTVLVDLQSIMHCDTNGMKFANPRETQKGRTSLGVPVPSIFHHASLAEFLLSPQRSEEFHIDVPQISRAFTETALKEVNELSSSNVSDQRYIVYCFLIMLQTQKLLNHSHTNQIARELSRWDAINDRILRDILQRLEHIFVSRTLDSTLGDIHQDLWQVFVPALARWPTQSQLDFHLQYPHIPYELLFLTDIRLSSSYQNFIPDFSEETNLPQLVLHDLYNTFIKDGMRKNLNSYRNDRSEWTRYVYTFQQHLGDHILDAHQVRRRIYAQVSAAFVCYINHIVALLDPPEGATIPKEIHAHFNTLKRSTGDNWQATIACGCLAAIGSFLWYGCPLSDDIISALENLINRLFPPDVVSNLEQATFPFGFYNPLLKAQLSNSFPSPCALPRFFRAPTALIFSCGNNLSLKWRCHLVPFHDYVRLYYIYNSAKSTSGRLGGGASATRPAADLDYIGDILALPAASLARKTTDPETGVIIDYINWSLIGRLHRFTQRYEQAERQHTLWGR